MSFDPVEAARHLSFFEGSKTMQTFKDRESDSDSLSRILESPSLETLKQLNEAGAGIFLMINQGNGQGRKKANVVAIRAYYADFDYRQPPRSGEWPLEPSLLVESSSGR